ncbi:hypothetical protein ACUBUD_20300 [Burkholderia metallica]
MRGAAGEPAPLDPRGQARRRVAAPVDSAMSESIFLDDAVLYISLLIWFEAFFYIKN